jgi:DNA / pantothenate metabolism flavoprotein
MTTPHIIVTAGPTHEPIDPVRYIANRSSGKQGFAIATALAQLGAQVTLIAGPVTLDTPPGVTRIDVMTAREMAAAVDAALPADAAIMVAAVADWRVEAAPQKIKKNGSGVMPTLTLVENPDILAELARSPKRPKLLIGFAAETENVVANAQAKLGRKGCDWIVANDVSGDVMGGAANAVHIVTADGVESWERMGKDEVAERLAERVLGVLGFNQTSQTGQPANPESDERCKRLFMGAIGFYEAARSLYQVTGELHWPAFYVLLAYSGELSVKSFVMLRRPGTDEAALQKKIGHKLSVGLNMAIEAGYQVPNHVTGELFEILNKHHVNHNARYLIGPPVEMKPHNLMLAAMAHHLTTIGAQMSIPVQIPAI